MSDASVFERIATGGIAGCRVVGAIVVDMDHAQVRVTFIRYAVLVKVLAQPPYQITSISDLVAVAIHNTAWIALVGYAVRVAVLACTGGTSRFSRATVTSRFAWFMSLAATQEVDG